MDRNAVAQAFIVSSEYFGRSVSDAVIHLYVADVDDLPPRDVLAALKALRMQPKRRSCPLPAEVRAYLSRGTSDQSPEQIAHRMAGAVARFGYTRPQQARDFMGEIGWTCVTEMGGYAALCQRLTTAEVPTFTAQARELARAHLEGTARAAPGLQALAEKTPERLKSIVGGLAGRLSAG